MNVLKPGFVRTHTYTKSIIKYVGSNKIFINFYPGMCSSVFNSLINSVDASMENCIGGIYGQFMLLMMMMLLFAIECLFVVVL